MGLHEEYVAYLAVHGLEPPKAQLKGEMLQFVHQLLNDPSESIRKQARHILSAIENSPGLMSEISGHLADEYSEFTECVELIQRVLKVQGINLPSQIYFGMFPTSVFNATAVPAQSGILCLLNTGLTSFLNNFSIGCCYAIREQTDKVVKIPPFSADLKTEPRLETALSIAISVAYQYLQHSEHGLPDFLPEKYDTASLALASHLGEAMKTFVVAHEVSHVLLGHFDQMAALTHLVRTPGGEITALNRSQQQEFEADIMAQRILIAIDRDSSEPSPWVGAGLCLLSAQVFLEQLSEKLFGLRFGQWSSEDTHPPALSRIDNLNKLIEREAGGCRSFQLSIQLFGLLMRYVELLATAKVELDNSGSAVDH